MLPNLIVIGAAKAGTTSLYRYLDLHPEIAMAPAKELDFFLEPNWARGVPWYESHFRAAPVRGEASPSYTTYPRRDGAPARMAQVVPEAKLVYMVRDPVARIVSGYRFNRWVLGLERRELDDVVVPFERSQYVASSSYALQLDRYLEHFPPEQLLVVGMEELIREPHTAIARVFRFLGVDDTFRARDFATPYNRTDGLHANRLGRSVRSALFRALGPHRARALKHRAPGALLRPLLGHPSIPHVELDPGLERALREYLREDAERLRALTGRPFADWSI